MPSRLPNTYGTFSMGEAGLSKAGCNHPSSLLASLIFWLVATFPLAAEEATGAVQVIVNDAVELPPSLSSGTLRSVFFGRMQSWPDGTPVTVFVLPESHPAHKTFCITFLKTFPYVLRKQWDQLTFTGSGNAPTVVATTYQLYDKVRSTPGAIGYANQLPGNDSPVKFVGSSSQLTDPKFRF